MSKEAIFGTGYRRNTWHRILNDKYFLNAFKCHQHMLCKALAGTLVTHGHNSEECAEAGSHWDLSMIVKLPGGTFLGLSMIVALPGVSVLGPLNDCDILSGLFMIVTLPRTSI